MIFRLSNEHSFILNNQYFFYFFFTIKILSKGNIVTETLCKNRGTLIKLEIKKKYKSWDYSFIRIRNLSFV